MPAAAAKIVPDFWDFLQEKIATLNRKETISLARIRDAPGVRHRAVLL